jgi:hypothetical protein
MSKDDALIAEMLLRLKAKASKGMPWTDDEQAAVELSIGKGGEIGVLTACCILVSKRDNEDSKALEIVRREIALKNSSPYVELSIYEAFTCIDMKKLASFRAAILSFIQWSLLRRAINLDNTIFLLGRLARTGESGALELLRSLAVDDDTEVKSNASFVLHGLK